MAQLHLVILSKIPIYEPGSKITSRVFKKCFQNNFSFLWKHSSDVDLPTNVSLKFKN